MQVFITILFAAVLVESIVNLIDNINDKETSWKYWASLIVGIAVSVLVAVNWNLDFFKMAEFSEPMIPHVGAVLTGFILSRGSNVVSDLIKMLTRNRE